ncbi:UNVERIFIED_CONTAM: hypothetical protein HDU68_006431, partial [Siphonaria sp. JEL0065]
ILEHLIELDPDVICLEELDAPHFTQFLEPTLGSIGYKGIYQQKPGSLDGCALFARTVKFGIESFRSVRYLAVSKEQPLSESDGSFVVPQNQVAILADLVHVDSGRRLVVVVTHLKAEKSALGESIRLQEAQSLLKELSTEFQDDRDFPIVIGADLNATPTSQEYAAQVYPFIEQHPLGLKSAYVNGKGAEGEPEYTTWKVRKGKESKHVIDYVFYRGALEVVSVLNMPEDVDEDRIPSFRYPSDHFALIVEFEWIV